MSITRDTLIKTVRETGGKLTKRGLVRELGISGDQRKNLRDLLKELTEYGTIIRTDRRTYRLADSLPDVMVLSVDHIDDHGDLIGVPARWEGKGKPPSVIIRDKKSHPKSQSARLGIGDRALCRITKKQDSFYGEIIKSLGEGPQRQLGVVIKGGRGWRIRPVEKGARYDHILGRGQMESLRLNDQDLVLYELTSACHKGDRIAKIVEVLGSANHPRSASIISLYAIISRPDLAKAKSQKLSRTPCQSSMVNVKTYATCP
ncbi:MAG: hypothetical protein JKX72_06380 [Robiginitomaculum sp.]|nr:hypothetical protein [Robiginitomaculum sp.]